MTNEKNQIDQKNEKNQTNKINEKNQKNQKSISDFGFKRLILDDNIVILNSFQNLK